MPYGLIFANGDLNDGVAVRVALRFPAHESKTQYVIAADGGLRHVQALGLRPDLVIGDLDSADPDQLQDAIAAGVEVRRYPPAKDETDLELALLAAAACNCDPIRLLAATGDRLDQTLSSIYLLALPALRGRDVRLVSGNQTAWLAHPGPNEVYGQPGDTLSLIPLAGDALGIVTEGLEYPLRRESLLFGPARGVSNVLIGERALFTFERGILLAIHTVGKA